MKLFFAFAVLLAGVSAAVPKATSSRSVEGSVKDAVKDLINLIVKKGLDPYVRESESFEFRLPVTDLFFVEAGLENLILQGLSNIKINKVQYNFLFGRVYFDFSIPKITASLGSAQATIGIGKNVYSAKVGGTVTIKDLTVDGHVRVYIGIITGTDILSTHAELSVKAIESDVNVDFFGNDLTDRVNNLIGSEVPAFLDENEDDINELLNHYLFQILEARFE